MWILVIPIMNLYGFDLYDSEIGLFEVKGTLKVVYIRECVFPTCNDYEIV